MRRLLVLLLVLAATPGWALCKRYKYNHTEIGVPSTRIPEFVICDLETELPTANRGEGDLSYSKDSDKLWKWTGTWVEVGAGGGGGAPTTASYITQVAEAGLSNEFALGSLTNGLLLNTTVTGIPTIYGGHSCAANQWLNALNASGAGTCAQPSFSNISGTASDAQVDGSLEADELVLAGDVDGTANANDLDEVAVEAEIESVVDLPDLQGTLTVAKGGTGSAPGADDQILVADSAVAATWRAMVDCVDSGGNHLNYTAATNTFSCGTSGATGTHNLLSATHPDTTAGSVARGDLITGQTATPKWQRLALNTNVGRYLRSDGTDLVYSSVAAAGAGACGANTWASTLTDNAAPTCTQPGFSNISGRATFAQIPQILGQSLLGHDTLVVGDVEEIGISTAFVMSSNTLDLATVTPTYGGTGGAPAGDDQVPVSNSAASVTWKTVPDCDTAATSKLLYDQATNTWSCGTDQTGTGSANTVSRMLTVKNDQTNYTLAGISAGWVTASTAIVCSAIHGSSTTVTLETLTVAGIEVRAGNIAPGLGFDLYVSSPYGLDGDIDIRCIGV